AYWSKRKRLRDETGFDRCPWKGRRCTDMALGGISKIVGNIRSASSDKYNELLNVASRAVRAEMVETMAHLKSSLCEIVALKLRFYQCLPYAIAALDGARWGGKEQARAKAHEIYAEIT
ncbi:unnamed protein product, partial [Prorocentrum cordatum]